MRFIPDFPVVQFILDVHVLQLQTVVAWVDVEMTVSPRFESEGGDEWATPPPLVEDTVLALSIIAD